MFKLFLHEFPSSEGILTEYEPQKYQIKFQYYVVTSNKYYTIVVKFKWCDVKVQIIGVECVNYHSIVSEECLMLFKQHLVDLLSIFHKYDLYMWMPVSQVPKPLAKSFFDLILSLKIEQRA